MKNTILRYLIGIGSVVGVITALSYLLNYMQGTI